MAINIHKQLPCGNDFHHLFIVFYSNIGDGLPLGLRHWMISKVETVGMLQMCRVFGPTSEGYEKFKAQHRLT